eukprot:scaffold16463_cov53-Phaeocystis_antarctica.AAC.2
MLTIDVMNGLAWQRCFDHKCVVRLPGGRVPVGAFVHREKYAHDPRHHHAGDLGRAHGAGGVLRGCRPGPRDEN